MSLAALIAATGAGGLTLGVTLGAAWTRARFPVSHVTKPICGCGDSRGLHKDGKGECRARRRITTNSIQSWVPCGCTLYDGPISITEYYSPPMLPPLEE